MKSLENLELSRCTKLSKLLENLVTTKSVEKFDVIGTSTRLICSSIPPSLVLTSLLGLCSLTHLDISYCNLNAIPDGISCLFSLKHLDPSGNNFGCLLEIIAQLSFLIYLRVENCMTLRLLPMLPFNIGYIFGYGCTSLETIPDVLQPNSSIEQRLSFLLQ